MPKVGVEKRWRAATSEIGNKQRQAARTPKS
jgi:hypothetical protein